MSVISEQTLYEDEQTTVVQIFGKDESYSPYYRTTKVTKTVIHGPKPVSNIPLVYNNKSYYDITGWQHQLGYPDSNYRPQQDANGNWINQWDRQYQSIQWSGWLGVAARILAADNGNGTYSLLGQMAYFATYPIRELNTGSNLNYINRCICPYDYEGKELFGGTRLIGDKWNTPRYSGTIASLSSIDPIVSSGVAGGGTSENGTTVALGNSYNIAATDYCNRACGVYFSDTPIMISDLGNNYTFPRTTPIFTPWYYSYWLKSGDGYDVSQGGNTCYQAGIQLKFYFQHEGLTFNFYDNEGIKRTASGLYLYDNAGVKHDISTGYFYDNAGTRYNIL